MLVLEDGRIFRGEPYGALGQGLGEAVFTTGMTGYQETLTDPSYHRQIVVQTAPQIGNTGWNDEDDESGAIQVAGYVVRDPARTPVELALAPSAGRGAAPAGDRRRRGRRHPGAGAAPARAGRDALGGVLRCRAGARRRARRAGAAEPADGGRRPLRRGHHPRALRRARRRRAAVPGGRAGRRDQVEHAADDGRAGHRDARAARVRARSRRSRRWAPDGFFLSNGPGDPATADAPVALTRQVLERRIPLFGICFGNQILARALGRGTYKLRYGHRGINIPVVEHATGRVAITSQNHGFAVEGAAGERWESPFGAGRDHPHLPERRLRRGAARARRARVQRAVPPRGRGRAARRRGPLRPVRRADGRRGRR